jgi:hypothetical protein
MQKMTENEDELGRMAAERLDLVHETRVDLDALFRQLVKVEGRKETGLTLMRAHGLLGELEEEYAAIVRECRGIEYEQKADTAG